MKVVLDQAELNQLMQLLSPVPLGLGLPIVRFLEARVVRDTPAVMKREPDIEPAIE